MCQENRGEVGEGVETLAADSIKSKQLNEGLKGANQSKPIVNWAEFLFKNKEALEEAVKVECALGEDECESLSDRELNCDEVKRVFFPEIISKKSTKKRFGSLKQFQDSLISVKDRKRRDKAVKKGNQFNSTAEASELSGRSLSDSDLVFHNEILTKKAKEALALGKRLGFEIEGNEEGALKELFDFECSGATGKSGGLLVVWDKSMFDLTLVQVEPSFILLRGKLLQGNIEVFLGNVYGPSQVKDQQRLWIHC
ncbi:hypothetical protein V6N13_005560 [Hibiscus sabdariffa]